MEEEDQLPPMSLPPLDENEWVFSDVFSLHETVTLFILYVV